MQRLNIIGAGNVAQSLARQWHINQDLEIGDIYVRSQSRSKTAATDHIGAGNIVHDLHKMRPAQYWMIATPDDQIAQVAKSLTKLSTLGSESCFFHLSGALDSSTLGSLSDLGHKVASVHPMMTFHQALDQRFDGVFCASEGTAADTISPLFESIGFTSYQIEKEHKVLYHLAAVMACNYLPTLAAASSNLLSAAKIPEKMHPQILGPIMQSTLDNILTSSPSNALTGPVARGDVSTIQKHLSTLAAETPWFLDLYKELAKVTLPISAEQGNARPIQLQQIQALLK